MAPLGAEAPPRCRGSNKVSLAPTHAFALSRMNPQGGNILAGSTRSGGDPPAENEPQMSAIDAGLQVFRTRQKKRKARNLGLRES